MENTDPLPSDSLESGPLREYANDVYFNTTFWDMTLVFGQMAPLTREPQPHAVEYHTAITVPWQQAKLMAYYLFAIVIAHEAANGRIGIPPQLIPKAGLDGNGQSPQFMGCTRNFSGNRASEGAGSLTPGVGAGSIMTGRPAGINQTDQAVPVPPVPPRGSVTRIQTPA